MYIQSFFVWIILPIPYTWNNVCILGVHLFDLNYWKLFSIVITSLQSWDISLMTTVLHIMSKGIVHICISVIQSILEMRQSKVLISSTSQQLIKSFEVCDLPVRAAKFVARKNWVVTGSVSIPMLTITCNSMSRLGHFSLHLFQDDMHVRVYNYNTLERVHQFEAHSDYLRSIAVHPTQSFILTSSGKPFSFTWFHSLILLHWGLIHPEFSP